MGEGKLSAKVDTPCPIHLLGLTYQVRYLYLCFNLRFLCGERLDHGNPRGERVGRLCWASGSLEKGGSSYRESALAQCAQLFDFLYLPPKCNLALMSAYESLGEVLSEASACRLVRVRVISH